MTDLDTVVGMAAAALWISIATLIAACAAALFAWPGYRDIRARGGWRISPGSARGEYLIRRTGPGEVMVEDVLNPRTGGVTILLESGGENGYRLSRGGLVPIRLEQVVIGSAILLLWKKAGDDKARIWRYEVT